jgi:hypothetical protein
MQAEFKGDLSNSPLAAADKNAKLLISTPYTDFT